MIDRSEAVNLAQQVLEAGGRITPRGVRALAEAVLAMDTELKRRGV